MNIFNVLSTGDSKIKEPSITSFLSFMLDPYLDHGLGFYLINHIEKLLTIKLTSEHDDVDIEIEIEPILRNKANKIRRDADILISYVSYNSDNSINLKRIICIENKIKETSISSGQMNELYENLKDTLLEKYDSIDIEKLEIYMVLLSPTNNSKATMETNNIKLTSAQHKKMNINWMENDGLRKKFTEILALETIGEIPTLNKDFIFLLKNLIEFSNNNFTSKNEEDVIEGKNKKEFVYNFNDYINLLSIDSSIKKDLVILHNYLLSEYKAEFRIAPRDKRITYAYQLPYSFKTIFFQIKNHKKDKLILQLRKSEDERVPTSKNLDIEEYKDYVYKVNVNKLENIFEELKSLIEKSLSFVKNERNAV
ncbi:MAG: hypothetical protein IPL26_13615 [Leptospiraceae bacterium]|nr:hypothetical protein [Leptospiraceae bacterium]